jgi:hypothetical protein
MNHSADHPHGHLLARILVLLALSAFFAVAAAGQQADNQSPFPTGRNNQDDQPKTVKDFLAKQKAEKAKKDHEELLKRGDELLQLTGQLESAVERNRDLSSSDRSKLDSVEKLAERIRKSLGGDGDDEDNPAQNQAKEAKPPETVKEAVVDLRQMAIKLVDELKKTSRFSISVVAIQSSNSVLKLVRFLRLRK